MRGRAPKVLALAGVVGAAAIAAGCGSRSDQALRDSLSALDTPAATLPPSPPSPNVECKNPTASLRPAATLPPPGRMPAGTFMQKIEERGHLVAGVDQNTLFFGYRDPRSGRLQGLEIDLLRQIAKAIFGDPNRIQLKVAVTSNQRLDYVKDGSTDVVADLVTINCERLQEVAFSTVYYAAKQRVLVPTSSDARSVRDLGGTRVCARAGTTTYSNIAKQPSHPIPYGVEQRTDCLVALQEGRVDAISADDSILRGFEAQDPYTKLLPGSLEPEPYGIVIAKSHPEFVRFVNGVLARMRAAGTLEALYRKWLGASAPKVPHALYKG